MKKTVFSFNALKRVILLYSLFRSRRLKEYKALRGPQTSVLETLEDRTGIVPRLHTEALEGYDKSAWFRLLLSSVERTKYTGPLLDNFSEFLSTGKPKSKVFSRGNAKLPFLSFSSLPGNGVCPGAGDCLKHCYSYKAWRTLSPFLRQLQNSILLDSFQGRLRIHQALDKELSRRVYKHERVDLRLYVDGDFRDLSELTYWMETLECTPKVRAYGYSKSLHLFKEYLTYASLPDNYRLNLSTGGTLDHLHADLLHYPGVRGQFVVAPIHGSPTKLSRDEKRSILQWARNEGYNRPILCPGKCGDCTRVGHICGLSMFDGATVLIPTH